MKKISLTLFLISLLSITPVFAKPTNELLFQNESSTISGSFKILNDTDGDVQIYTGSGFVELNKGASTSVTCEAGREIRKANKGKKGDVIFTVEDSMCGKTVKLSKYL